MDANWIAGKLHCGMPERLTPWDRSALMARIRSKDTQPEMLIRSMVHRMGYRFLLHDKRLPGRPDLVFPRRHCAVFVNGCFWHGHDCGRGFKPKRNAAFWSEKLARNKQRDADNQKALNLAGWRVLVVWECETRLVQLPELQVKLVEFLGAR